jgi:hypothetical protein
MPHHVFGDGGFGNLNAQLEQLAVNAWCTPTRVVSAHHPDQITNLLRHAGQTWLAAADFPRPEQAKAFTMQTTTVSALTIIRTDFQSLHKHRNQTQKIRSAGVSFSRFGADRRKTASYCRKARFSSRSWVESIEVRAPSTVNRRCCADQRSK